MSHPTDMFRDAGNAKIMVLSLFHQKTKNQPILGQFSKSYNHRLWLIGCTYRIDIFRADKACKVTTFEPKQFAKFGH